MIVEFNVTVVPDIAVILKYSSPLSPEATEVAIAISSPTYQSNADNTVIVVSPTFAGAASYVQTVAGKTP